MTGTAKGVWNPNFLASTGAATMGTMPTSASTPNLNLYTGQNGQVVDLSSLGNWQALNQPGVGGQVTPQSNSPYVTSAGDMTTFGKWATGLNAASALGGLYLSGKQLGQAEDTFNWNKGVTALNIENQAGLTNLGLREREIRRGLEKGLTSDQAAAAADEYIAQHGVRGKV